MLHRVNLLLWNDEPGESILFARLLTLPVEPLPASTLLDGQMARSRYFDGLEAYVAAMFGDSPFHVNTRG